MKHSSLITLAALAFLTACQPQSSNEDIETLTSRRDSIQTAIANLRVALDEVNVDLALLDSTRNFSTITALAPSHGAFAHSFKVYGTVNAEQSVNLIPEMPGRITQVHVRGGERVQAGQVLVSLDGSVLAANLSEVESQLMLAKKLYDKQSSLWSQGIGSEIQYLQSKTNFDALTNRLQSVKEQLALTEIRAPFNGTVEVVNAKAGEYASPGMPLVLMGSQSGLRLEAHIPENYIKSVHQGDMVNIYFESIEEELVARISQVGGYINPGSRTFMVAVDLPSKPYFKPNMMAQMDIVDYRADSATFIPSRLVLQDPEGRDFTYVVTEGANPATIQRRDLVLGRSNRESTEILSGLESTDIIVDKGIRSIQIDQMVNVLDK